MWVARLRDPRVLAGLVIAVISFALLALVDIVPVASYREETLFSLPWGSAEGMVGRASAADGTLYGPRSFAVGNKQIYVADTFNARIQIFDLQGRLLQVMPLAEPEGEAGPGPDATLASAALPASALATFAAQPAAGDEHLLQQGDPWINDLAVDDKGNIFLADSAGAQILQLDSEGRKLSEIDVSATIAPEEEDALWLLEQLALDKRGLVYLAHTYLSDQVYSRSLLRLDPAVPRFVQLAAASLRQGGRLEVEEGSLLPVPTNSFALAADGSLYVESPGPDLFARHVRRYDADNRLLADWIWRQDQPIITATLLGVDRYNQAYLLLNAASRFQEVVRLGGNHDLPARIVAAGGEDRADTPGPAAEIKENIGENGSPRVYQANVYGRVGGDGTIYLAAADDRGWHLKAWQVSWRRRLQSAGGARR